MFSLRLPGSFGWWHRPTRYARLKAYNVSITLRIFSSEWRWSLKSRASQFFDSILAFGADQLDINVVNSYFLPGFLDQFLVRKKSVNDSVSNAFNETIGKHTEIFLLGKSSIDKYRLTPYSMPDGEHILCCGKPMEYKKIMRRPGAVHRVKLRCTLASHHPKGESASRTITCTPSIPGVRSVIERTAHRFMIFHSPLET